jgi:BlaI family transcriptional regulator, penicillinase repressor
VANLQLSHSELQIMKALWQVEKGFLNEIINNLPEPRPAYTTIATVLNRMVKKGYISFIKCGRDKEYYPVLQKDKYFSAQVKSTIRNFFDDSAAQFASFFTRNTEMSLEQLEELHKIVEDQIYHQRNKKC